MHVPFFAAFGKLFQFAAGNLMKGKKQVFTAAR